MKNILTRKTLTPADEAHYINAYLPLVYKVVRPLAAQTSHVMDVQDMIQVAQIGLLSSLRRYGKPDASFAAYASLRIRGAVLDELRLLDWRPRRMRQKMHKLNDTIRDVAQVLGHIPRFHQLHERLTITFAQYQEYCLLSGASVLESLDYLLAQDIYISALESRALEEEVVISRTLYSALERLTPREQNILALYYQRENTLKEIALMYGLTEARVCQINKKTAQKIGYFFAT